MSLRRMLRIRRWGLVLVAFGMVVSCGGGSPGSDFEAWDAWTRPTPLGSTNAVVYLEVSSDRPDVLESVSVPEEVAGAAQLHLGTDATAGGAHEHGGPTGDTHTLAVEDFSVDVGSPLVLEPGGRHLMLVDLSAPLRIGGDFDITLRFASGRSLVVPVQVTYNPPG